MGSPAQDINPETHEPQIKSHQTRQGWHRGKFVEYRVVNGMAVLEGDILLGTTEDLSDKKSEPERSAFAINGNRWTGGIIPFTISPTMPNQQRILDAVAHWNTNLSGYLQLVPRTSQTAYLTFVEAAPGTCSSYVGSLKIAGQPVNIGEYCSTGNVIHEIGHAVGLYHEHTRTDRDQYVIIYWANIDPNASGNFSIPGGILFSGYDYGSIMHYGAYAFSINGQPTIQTIPAGIAIGQRSGLSIGDITGVQAMYGAVPPPPPPPPTTISATFTSSINVKLVIDGANVSTPATLNWIIGSNHTVSAPNTKNGVNNVTFVSWSDGGAQTHTVTAPANNFTLNAIYTKTKGR